MRFIILKFIYIIIQNKTRFVTLRAATAVVLVVVLVASSYR